jgi:hypothetical protein
MVSLPLSQVQALHELAVVAVVLITSTALLLVRVAQAVAVLADKEQEQVHYLEWLLELLTQAVVAVAAVVSLALETATELLVDQA